MVPALTAAGHQVSAVGRDLDRLRSVPGGWARSTATARTPGWSAFAASKAALQELADSLGLEEAEHGLRVTTIYPGATAPEQLRQVRAPAESQNVVAVMSATTTVAPETEATPTSAPRRDRAAQAERSPGRRGGETASPGLRP